MSEGFSYKITGVEEVTGEIREAIIFGDIHGLEKIGMRGQQLVSEAWPVGATGFGAHSVAWALNGTKAVRIFEGAPADVYAAPVETGARPHFPPPQALYSWVMKKTGETDPKKVASIAFLIARAIARRGTPPHNMFEHALEVLASESKGLLEIALAQELQRRGIGGKG